MIRIFYKLIFIVLLLTEQANGSCSRAAHRTSKSTDAEGKFLITHLYLSFKTNSLIIRKHSYPQILSILKCNL